MNSNSGFIHAYSVLHLQLAVSNTNKLYIWGASPQVLRLQAQAQKKTRILEQQDVNEKKSKTKALAESEKIPSGGTNLNGEIKEEFLQVGVQQTNVSAQMETIASDIETQKKRRGTEDTDSRDLNFDLIEENQAHLKPCVVDTSLVKGQINQVRGIRSLKFILRCALSLVNITNIYALYL